MTLTVESTRFGTLEVDPDAVIEFPLGLIGLDGSRYAIVATDEASPFHWLHSLEDPSLALPVCDPWLFFADYAVELSDEEITRAGVGGDEHRVWVTVRAGASPEDFSANLRAPILISGGRGHQVINEAADAPVRAPLFAGAVA